MFSLGKKLLAPKLFYQLTTPILPWITVAFSICITYGLIGGLFLAPPDYQQGDGFRIIYVHVPSAFTSLFIYFIMAFSAVLFLVWRIKIASLCLFYSARLGAWFTFLALATGAIWGKPMWGTWWVWDARLTSVLILFFLYMGIIALQSAIPRPINRDKACSILAIVGIINLPIIHYSVIWWNTLHQGPSIISFRETFIAKPMLYPLVSMIIAFLLYYTLIVFNNIRIEIQKDTLHNVS